MMKADLILHNIKELITPFHEPPVRGPLMNDLLSVQNAFIAIQHGKILGFGSGSYELFVSKTTKFYDCMDQIVVPGFIDGHTHLVFGGSREYEFSDKVAGVPYLEILRRGGGIFSTVEATRSATKKELTEKAAKSLAIMLSFGVTVIEAKSGYGLDVKTEIKQLEVAAQLHKSQPIDIVSTYLGAHAVPKEFHGKTADYIDLMMETMRLIKSRNLAVFADVFCEEGVFTSEESKRILEGAKAIGLIPKIHADEIVSTRGAKIGVNLQASSADHLMAVHEDDIPLLAQSDTVANLLPGTSFYLGKAYADARKLIDSGVAVSIASDYNPGSSPCENFQLIMQLAAGKLRMTPKEILTAVTINAAYALRMTDQCGSVAIGKNADLVVLDAKNLDYIFYHYGINHTRAVFKNGTLVFENPIDITGGIYETY